MFKAIFRYTEKFHQVIYVNYVKDNKLLVIAGLHIRTCPNWKVLMLIGQ